MIAGYAFDGKPVAVVGLGAPACDGARPRRRAARGRAWDDNETARARRAQRASGPSILARRTGTASPRSCYRPAFRSPIRSRIGRSPRARAAGVPIICDVEFFCRGVRASAGRAVRRHHRHQRQVDDDGADRPHPRSGRPDAKSAAISAAAPRRSSRSRRSGLRPRNVVLPARARALAHAVDRHPAQPHAGPSRPPWRHGGLCRGQGADLRRAPMPPWSASTTAIARCAPAIEARARRLRIIRSPPRARSTGAIADGQRLSSATAGMGRSRRRRSSISRTCAPCRAHNAQNAAAAAAAWLADVSREEIAAGCGPIPACRTARSASPSAARSSSSTTARRPMPTPRRARCSPTTRRLDRRRQGEGGRHRAAAAAVSDASPRPS